MTASMTHEEVRVAMKALQPAIWRYAQLIVRKGVHVKPGQELVVRCPVERADFCRDLVRAGYEAGAGHVTVIWSDDVVSRLEYEHVETAWFETVPAWQRAQLDDLAAMGACFVFIDGSDPEALLGIDPAKPAAASKAKNQQCTVFRHGLDFNENPWCIAGAPVAAWAQHVFPQENEEVGVYQLWRAILSVARADGDDPESDWELHDARFEKNLRFLNERHFKALHYTASNGTDLSVGLTDKHVWAGGKGKTPDGHDFFPNIPTEEVFTSPHCEQVDGVVYSALPLIHHGNKIDRFWLRFEQGRVVEFDAAVGKETLKGILDTDEGGRRLGEVALISKNTPIRESGLLFYSTLYDENASCHLALGIGFPECYEGGYELSAEELRERGVNSSHTHVDFMIGTDDLSVTGICEDGSEVPVFVNGQWSWE
ncbi:aminopeptidase [Collinsella sp. zg1085]|uniref:aminopeptidase n=1 Tax=Collinsella sp. zg1085 TaxID=2844380 RepID=UPI001C0DA00C|nr:aminopeptidase [Collinsella sp. zg1085]QWT17542.1 aminopeptidase [Collinsella sp. zg1085]